MYQSALDTFRLDVLCSQHLLAIIFDKFYAMTLACNIGKWFMTPASKKFGQ